MKWIFQKDQTGKLKSFLKKNGFVGIGNLMTKKDQSDLSRAVRECIAAGKIKTSISEVAGNDDMIDKHPFFLDLIRSRKMVKLLKSLFKESQELQHSKLNIKPPGMGGEIALHQDYPFFPHTNFDLFAVSFHMDNTGPGSGAMEVVPGSHKWGPLTHTIKGKFQYQCTEKFKKQSLDLFPLFGPAGMVSIHHCLTLHRSAIKTVTDERRMLVYQLRATDSIQLAGTVWNCAGIPIGPEVSKGFARFPDGTLIETRGTKGRLYDLYGKLAPDT